MQTNRSQMINPQALAPRYSSLGDDNRAQIRAMVAAMCSELPSPGTSTDAEATLEIFVGVLHEFNHETVRRACGAALSGRMGASGGRFRPTVAEMATWCREAEMPPARDTVERRIEATRRVAHTRVEISPERRRELSEMVRSSFRPLDRPAQKPLGEMEKPKKPSPAELHRNAVEFLEAKPYDHSKPAVASAELRRLFANSGGMR